jgi:hypothetical protein
MQMLTRLLQAFDSVELAPIAAHNQLRRTGQHLRTLRSRVTTSARTRSLPASPRTHDHRAPMTTAPITRSLLLSVPLWALLASTVPAPVAQSQEAPPDPRLYASDSWSNVVPFLGGRVGAVSGAIGQPGTFYARYPGGGPWKTTSGDTTWFPIFDAVKTVSSIGAGDQPNGAEGCDPAHELTPREGSRVLLLSQHRHPRGERRYHSR